MNSSDMINTRRIPNWIINIIIPLFYLLITLAVDYSIPYSTITPLMGISGLMVFSFRLKPFWMIVWAVIYSSIVACIFLIPGFYSGFANHIPTLQDPVTPWLRTLTFVLGSALSSILCVTMERLVKSENSMRELIGKLPVPVITSDINGDIIFTNHAADLLLESDVKSLGNYFDLFTMEGHQGALIASYLARFGQQKKEEPISLNLNGKLFRGKTHVLYKSQRPLLLTIIDLETHRLSK